MPSFPRAANSGSGVSPYGKNHDAVREAEAKQPIYLTDWLPGQCNVVIESYELVTVDVTDL